MNLSIPLKPFRTFGGAKVPHRKHTGSSPSEVIPTPEKVRIPMQMHIGAPCKPLVKVGEQVLVGQKSAIAMLLFPHQFMQPFPEK